MTRRTFLGSFALFVSTFALGVSLPREASAQKRGGRVHNPRRLRTRAESASRGRVLRDSRKGPAVPRQPGRRRALIPNPEPQPKGGRGYSKRGDKYYQKPGQIRVGGNPKRHIERVKIPHPNKKLR